jgi:hypothetical protein
MREGERRRKWERVREGIKERTNEVEQRILKLKTRLYSRISMDYDDDDIGNDQVVMNASFNRSEVKFISIYSSISIFQ